MAHILHELGIEPGALVVNLVSFLVLLWLMKRYLFGPVGAFLEQRRQMIHQEISAAEADRAAAAAQRAEIESSRAAVLEAARAAAKSLEEAAAREAESIRSAARSQARDIERAARAATERERQEAAAQLRDEVGSAAVAMCRRLLRESLNEERHRALLEAFISDVERLASQQPPR